MAGTASLKSSVPKLRSVFNNVSRTRFEASKIRGVSAVISVVAGIGSCVADEEDSNEERAARWSPLNPADDERRCERCVCNSAAPVGAVVRREDCVGTAIA